MTASLAEQANQLIASGRPREALDVMAKIGDPSGNAALLENIGVCHYRLGAHADALTYLRRALAAAPGTALTINNIAMISSEVGPAEVADETALTPATLNDIGLNAYFRGDFDEARQRLEAAITLKPNHFAAYHNMADLIEPSEATSWLDRISALAPETPHDCAAIGYLKAHLLDQLSDCTGAMAAWADAAAARRASFDAPFNADGHNALIDGVIAAFTTERLRRLQTGSVDERRYVFIVGLPRSGSTLTGRLIGGDPALVDLGERRSLAGEVANCLNAIGGPHDAAFAQLARTEAASIYQAYCSDLPETGIFLDKYLENTLLLGLIWAAFPNARIIYTKRDRFDCLFSCYTKNFAMGNEWTYRPEDLIDYAKATDRLMAHWAQVLPPDMLMISEYEALTQDPEVARRRLCLHARLDPDIAAAQGHQTGGIVRTASAKQIRQGVKWRDVSPYEAYKSLIDL